MADLTPRMQQNYSIPVVSPVGTAVNNLGTASQQVIGANAVRRKILFHNPGSVNVVVCPANLTANPASLGGMYVIFPGSELPFAADPNAGISCNCAWNAAAATGSNNPLTVYEFL